MNGLQYTPEEQRKLLEKIERGTALDAIDAGVLLREIYETAWKLNATAAENEQRLARVMALSATLSASLSIKADRVQRWMVGLTVAIAIMTLVLVALTVVMLCKTS